MIIACVIIARYRNKLQNGSRRNTVDLSGNVGPFEQSTISTTLYHVYLKYPKKYFQTGAKIVPVWLIWDRTTSYTVPIKGGFVMDIDRLYKISERSIKTTPVGKGAFAKFVREKCDYNETNARELAAQLEISYEVFRKILNKEKPTKRRDFIIAVCAMLYVTLQEADEGLRLYDMAILNEKYERDKIIIDIIKKRENDPKLIQKINESLENDGFSPLDIHAHKKKVDRPRKVDKPRIEPPYEVLDTIVSTSYTDIYGLLYNQYDSLETEYSFDRYACRATVSLADNTNKKTYKLTAGLGDDFHIMIYPSSDENPFRSFKTIDETGDFMDYFKELQRAARKELQRVAEVLNDTRNYYERIGAGICNDSIHIYMEKFNYSIPERNEYYLFEYINGIYRLTVYEQSIFMRKYLTAEEYRKYYENTEPRIISMFDSLEQIETLRNDPKLPHEEKTILGLRTRAYKQMKHEVDNCLTQLRKRKIFVRNLSAIYEENDRVCAYYGLEKEFQCTFTDEYEDIMIAGADAVDILSDDGKTVSITLSDLYRAFELGFDSVDAICRVKLTKGSIEAVLN